MALEGNPKLSVIETRQLDIESSLEFKSDVDLKRLVEAIRKLVVVREEVLRLVVVSLIAKGHILLEDVPGVGKTLLGRTLAQSIGGDFKRIQFTPDLLPSDITGGNIYDPKNAEFEFRPGPIFSNIILADEINRATPRAQSSLLEAMGEGAVSIDGKTRELPSPFLVIATQNPVEQYGTFPLPESELDRFMVMLRLGRPDTEMAKEILRRHEHSEPARHLEPVLSLEIISRLQEQVLAVHASEAARTYVAAISIASRTHSAVSLPASPRATVSLLRASQAFAVYEGRSYVLPDDIKAVASSVLAHRLAVSSSSPEETVEEIVESVDVPLWD
jgi:MoxR-like ATPase